jgi:hypothetical protein
MRKRTILAVAATLAVGATPAAARPPDTFSGTCAGLEGYASWPEQNLTVVPVDMLLRAHLSGGACSGTLNGREVESVPATARATLRGPQSCTVAATSGRFTFELAGRRITGRMTYRRTSSRVTALWEGDGGGSALVLVHARVGPVGEPVGLDEALQRCAGEGIDRMPIFLDRMATTPTLSG